MNCRIAHSFGLHVGALSMNRSQNLLVYFYNVSLNRAFSLQLLVCGHQAWLQDVQLRSLWEVLRQEYVGDGLPGEYLQQSVF